MRLALLPSSYFPDSLGGTEVYVRELARTLAELGHRVAVVYHSSRPGVTTTDDHEVSRLPEHAPRRRSDLYRFCRGQEPAGFGDFLDRWRPDLVHFHALTLGAGLDHARAVKRRGLPYLVTYHTPTFSCRRGTLLRWGREACDGVFDRQRCAACVLHSRGIPRPLAVMLGRSPLPWDRLPDGPWVPRLALPSLLQSGHDCWREFMEGAAHIVACAEWCRTVLIANGLAPERISVHRQALPGPDRTRRLKLPVPIRQPLRIGFFGRLTRVKGPDLLLAALRRLRQRGIEVAAELVGPIDHRDRYWVTRLLHRADGLASYRGVKQATALAEWLETLDLVVVPSRCFETGPLTVLEAWDRGVPVIGSEHSGIAEFLRGANQATLLFPAGDAEALAHAILRALDWQGPDQPGVTIPGMTSLAQRMEALYRAAVGRE